MHKPVRKNNYPGGNGQILCLENLKSSDAPQLRGSYPAPLGEQGSTDTWKQGRVAVPGTLALS